MSEPLHTTQSTTRAKALTVVDAAEACRTGKLTAVDLTERALAAANRFTGTGFVRLRECGALSDAAQRDRNPMQDALLAGVPIAHKDMFYRAGELSECGSAILNGFTPDITATVITRLEAAGAVDIGALHMAEFAMSPTGYNEQIGHGRNPWSESHVSGGSSSGSGVVTAARLVSAALGSDTGGSVRIPAAVCGVTGLKPTQNLVSVYGVMPLSPSLDCVGFLAQTARDCARLLSAVTGPDVNDPTCVATEKRDYEGGIEVGLQDGVRIAVPAFDESSLISTEVRECLEESACTLAGAGATLVRVQVPDFNDLGALANLILGAEAASVHQRWLASRADDYGQQVRRRIERGLLYPAARYIDVLRLRPLMLARFLAQFLPDVDALLLPVLPYAVPTIEETTKGSESEIEARFGGFSYWTRGINYLGLPALALPVGKTANSLPCAVQLVGRPFGEAALLRIGHQYQQRTDWHEQSPV
jgi:aspartyl-tRNA(Asn)/glutamyl-tRNA(Gln) amidotransferase subunit A